MKTLLKENQELKNKIQEIEQQNKLLMEEKTNLEENLQTIKKENKNLLSMISKLNADETIIHQNSRKKVQKFLKKEKPISINQIPTTKNIYPVESSKKSSFEIKTINLQIKNEFSKEPLDFNLAHKSTNLKSIEHSITNISNSEIKLYKIEFISTSGFFNFFLKLNKFL